MHARTKHKFDINCTDCTSICTNCNYDVNPTYDYDKDDDYEIESCAFCDAQSTCINGIFLCKLCELPTCPDCSETECDKCNIYCKDCCKYYCKLILYLFIYFVY